jgi:hypothetical protein
MTAEAPFKALEIGPDGWAHGILIGEVKIDRPKPAKEGAEEGSDEITQIVTADDCAAIIAASIRPSKPPFEPMTAPFVSPLACQSCITRPMCKPKLTHFCNSLWTVSAWQVEFML